MSTLSWSVRLASEPATGQPTIVGYGESPEQALADLDAGIARIANDAMEYATQQAAHAARIRAEVRALGA